MHGIAISLYTSLIGKQKANQLHHLSEQRCLVRTRSRCLVPNSAAPGYESATGNERYSASIEENLHHRPANETDEDHEEPAGNDAESVDSIAQRDVESVLSDPSICWVQVTLVSGNIEVGLLGVDIVDVSSGNSGRVQVDHMKRRGGTFRSILGLGNLEVPITGGACSPSRAKNLVFLAVQVTQIRRSRVGREQKNGFLALESQRPSSQNLGNYPYCPGDLTLNALLALSQRPKQVLFPPVIKRSHSLGSEDGSKADCQLDKLKGVTAFS